jgi:hypothetical protein
VDREKRETGSSCLQTQPMRGRIQQRGSDDNESLLSSWFLGAAGPAGQITTSAKL